MPSSHEIFVQTGESLRYAAGKQIRSFLKFHGNIIKIAREVPDDLFDLPVPIKDFRLVLRSRSAEEALMLRSDKMLSMEESLWTMVWNWEFVKSVESSGSVFFRHPPIGRKFLTMSFDGKDYLIGLRNVKAKSLIAERSN